MFTLKAISPLLSQHTQQVSVHQRCAGGAMEGFAVQYSREKANGGVGSTRTQDKHGGRVQDAYVIFGARPPDSMRFVQHSRGLMGEHSCSSESQAQVIASKSTTPLRRRRKDPHRPRGYVSAFNYFVKARRAAYVRDEQVTFVSEIFPSPVVSLQPPTTIRQPSLTSHLA